MNITFNKLKGDSKIFEELKKNPSWWTRFKNDKSLYIEIRKDNQVNVYFEGGSIIRVHYCSRRKELQTFTHYKYLGIKDKTKTYVNCAKTIDKQIGNIVEGIKKHYSPTIDTIVKNLL